MKREAFKNNKKDKALTREQILQSMLASFKIEGINIPTDLANATLKKLKLHWENRRNKGYHFSVILLC